MKLQLRFAKFGSRKRVPIQEVVCQECHNEITADAIFCLHCRAPVVRRYCPGCSKLVPETTSLCPYCGVSSKITPKYPLSISLVPIVLLIGITIFLVFLAQDEEQSQVSVTSPVNRPVSSVGKPEVDAIQFPANQERQPQEEEEIVYSDEEGTRLNLRGHQLITEGSYLEAVAVLEKAVKTFPPETSAIAYKYALYNLGHALRRIGRPKEAISYLEQCLEIEAGWEMAKRELDLAKKAAAAKSNIS